MYKQVRDVVILGGRLSDSVIRGFLVRLPQLKDSVRQSNSQADWFLPSPFLRSDITSFADSYGTYAGHMIPTCVARQAHRLVIKFYTFMFDVFVV